MPDTAIDWDLFAARVQAGTRAKIARGPMCETFTHENMEGLIFSSSTHNPNPYKDQSCNPNIVLKFQQFSSRPEQEWREFADQSELQYAPLWWLSFLIDDRWQSFDELMRP